MHVGVKTRQGMHSIREIRYLQVTVIFFFFFGSLLLVIVKSVGGMYRNAPDDVGPDMSSTQLAKGLNCIVWLTC